MRRLRLVAATFVVAAAGLVVAAPAQAATCSSAKGVSVVVDFHQLGGGVQTYCDATGAGKYADKQFADAGHQLTYVQNEAFVCQVDGAPQSDCTHTPPSDAYWSLWWSDGTSGTWKYASVGVASLKVPQGGYVALSWQGQSSQAKPRVTPTAHTTSPSSSPSSSSPSTPHATSSSQPRVSSSAPAAPSASSSDTAVATPLTSETSSPRRHQHHQHRAGSRHRHHNTTRSASAQAQPALPRAATASRPAGSGSGGVPGWVTPGAIAALFAGSGAVVWARRRSRGGV